MHDIMIILVLTFPMFIFTIYPGVLVSNYIQKHHNINESSKRIIMLSVTFFGALFLSLLLYFM